MYVLSSKAYQIKAEKDRKRLVRKGREKRKGIGRGVDGGCCK